MAYATITCSPNGPYIVRGLGQLRTFKGDSLPVKPVIALCRCGGSANKPFCDGTHKSNGFSGTNLGGSDEKGRRTYQGKAIAIHDDRSICAHAGYCTDDLAAVFKSGAGPWIQADNATAEEIIALVRRCPSGALTYGFAGDPSPETGGDAVVTVSKDGPYAVTGECNLADVPLAEGAPATRYTLCRCGGSKNKPFCDGSHWDLGFSDERN